MKYIFITFIIILSSTSFAKKNLNSLGKFYYEEKFDKKFGATTAIIESNLKDLSSIGDKNADYMLGMLYTQNDNYKQAFEYFAKACEKNDAKSCNNAGFIKHHNLEKLKELEDEKASQYYKKAIELNDNYALFNMARYYIRKKDYFNSYLYYEIVKERFDDKLTRQITILNKDRMYANISQIEKEYLKYYYPVYLEKIAGKKIIGNRKINPNLPIPSDVSKIKHNEKFIKYKEEVPKNTKLLMIKWMPEKNDFIDIPISIVTEDISSNEALASLTYRYHIPAVITFTLTSKKTILPVLLGDELKVYIYAGTKHEKNDEWEIKNVSPMMSLSINKKIEYDGEWQIFTLSPQIKSDIKVKFLNKMTNKTLDLEMLTK